MKRLLLFTICLLCASSVYAIDISRLEPACWWVGMKNPELQIMVYGKNIASSQVYIDYPGVRVKEIVGVENPNYLFLYLDISRDASPGTMNLIFQKGKEKEIRAFELKERNKISGITSKNGRNDAKRLNIRVVTVSNDDKPKNRETQRKADLRRRMVCKSLPVKE